MKQRRTSLPSDAARESAHAPFAPTPSVDAGASPAAALRERLTQTRARMAKKAPQIYLDWDPEELPTRYYTGEPLVPWKEHAPQLWDETPAQRRTRLGSGEVPVQRDDETPCERPRRARARSGEVAIDPCTRTRAPTIDAQDAFSEATNDWSACEPLDPSAFPDGNGAVRSQHDALAASAPRVRARSGEVLIGTQFGDSASVDAHASDALVPEAFPGARPERRVRELLTTPLSVDTGPAPHIAPISERPTRAPLALVVQRELSALRQYVQAFVARLDHSDEALRNRVAVCSGGLLLVAAGTLLFSHHAPATQPSAAPAAAVAAAPLPPPRNVSVAISSDPAGAEIFIDGRASGKITPTSIGELTPGKHRIGLQLAGYREATEALHLPEDALVSIKLAALNQPRVAPRPIEPRPQTAAEARAQARERRAAARAARAMSRYRARMGMPADPAR